MSYVDLQIASTSSVIPALTTLQLWVSNTLEEFMPEAEVTIRVVDEIESRQLNKTFRDKDRPTNVLAFPFEKIPGINIEHIFLGDLVVCAPLVATEASEQQKSLDSHWAHLVTHGLLHLLGYDHVNDHDAQIMENIEIRLLNKLGYPNPYE